MKQSQWTSLPTKQNVSNNSQENFHNMPNSDVIRGLSKQASILICQTQKSTNQKSNMHSMQSLQTIKDQIFQLKNNLKNSTSRKTSTQKEPKSNQQTEKSFFNLIKDQLKQVNQLQNNTDNDNKSLLGLTDQNFLFKTNIQRRQQSQKQNKGMIDWKDSSYYRQTEAKRKDEIDNQDYLKVIKGPIYHVETKIQRAKELRSQLQSQNIRQLEDEEEQTYHNELKSIKQQKLLKLENLKKYYKEEKQKIFDEINLQIEKETQNYKNRISNRIEEYSKSQNQVQKGFKVDIQESWRTNEALRSSSSDSEDTQYDALKFSHYLSKDMNDKNDKNDKNDSKQSLISSLKKQKNLKKQYQVRFKNQLIQVDKNEISRQLVERKNYQANPKEYYDERTKSLSKKLDEYY